MESTGQLSQVCRQNARFKVRLCTAGSKPLSFWSYPLPASFFNCCCPASPSLTALHPSFLPNQIDILVFTFKSLDRFSTSSLAIMQTALACQLSHPVSQWCPFSSFPEQFPPCMICLSPCSSAFWWQVATRDIDNCWAAGTHSLLAMLTPLIYIVWFYLPLSCQYTSISCLFVLW